MPEYKQNLGPRYTLREALRAGVVAGIASLIVGISAGCPARDIFREDKPYFERWSYSNLNDYRDVNMQVYENIDDKEHIDTTVQDITKRDI